jgi:mannosyltransferase OCH1-like enzyme
VIPKIAHFNWFGGKPHSELVKICTASWMKHLPDYQIICWNEENFRIDEQCVFVRDAYAARKYAFVSDYVQAWAISEFGGIYIDSDVELIKGLDRFLHHRAFIGFQESGLPFTALWGSEKAHPFALRLRHEYEAKTAFVQEINTEMVSRILVEEYGVDANMDAMQHLSDGLILYPSDYFCVDFDLYGFSDNNHARHHFNTSWIEKDDKPSLNFYKEFVYKKHLFRKLSNSGNLDITINNIVENFDNDLLLRRIGKRKVMEFLFKDLLRLRKKSS